MITSSYRQRSIADYARSTSVPQVKRHHFPFLVLYVPFVSLVIFTVVEEERDLKDERDLRSDQANVLRNAVACEHISYPAQR